MDRNPASCLVFIVGVLGLTLVTWIFWPMVSDLLEEWRANRGQGVEVVEPTPPPRQNTLPGPSFTDPNPDPVPFYQVRSLMVSDSVDIFMRKFEANADWEQVLEDYIDLSYYDTEVAFYLDTLFARDALLIEVMNLEESRMRDFYMWDKFDLTVNYDMRPDSIFRIYVDLTGHYTDEVTGDLTPQMAESNREYMRKKLEGDLTHLLTSLEYKMRKVGDNFIRW